MAIFIFIVIALSICVMATPFVIVGALLFVDASPDCGGGGRYDHTRYNPVI